jgi:hypothetical protein
LRYVLPFFIMAARAAWPKPLSHFQWRRENNEEPINQSVCFRSAAAGFNYDLCGWLDYPVVSGELPHCSGEIVDGVSHYSAGGPPKGPLSHFRWRRENNEESNPSAIVT